MHLFLSSYSSWHLVEIIFTKQKWCSDSAANGHKRKSSLSGLLLKSEIYHYYSLLKGIQQCMCGITQAQIKSFVFSFPINEFAVKVLGRSSPEISIYHCHSSENTLLEKLVLHQQYGNKNWYLNDASAAKVMLFIFCVWQIEPLLCKGI